MGNLVGKPQKIEHVLELRLAAPHVDAPVGQGGQSCQLFAQVGVLGDPSMMQRVSWEKAVAVRFTGDSAIVVVSIFAVDPTSQQAGPHFLAEVCLPYASEGGLTDRGVSAGGAVVPLRLALVPGVRYSQAPQEAVLDGFRRACREFRKDSPFLALSVRELTLEEANSPVTVRGRAAQGVAQPAAGFGSPLNRHKAITLAFENAALDAQRRSLQRSGPEPDEEPESPAKELSQEAQGDHMRQLLLFREDNAQLQGEMAAARQKLESLKGGKSSNSASELSQQAAGQNPNWGRTLDVMQAELAHCRARQGKIRTSYDQRLQVLKNQLVQVRKEASTAEAAVVAQSSPNLSAVAPGVGGGAADRGAAEAAGLRECIAKAVARRGELQKQLEEARWVQATLAAAGGGSPITTAAMLSDNPEAQRLVDQSKQYKAELASLQQELALEHERESGSERQQQLRQQVQQLYDQLDELHQLREDERVRSESEVRELRKERDGCRDRLDDAAAELRRLRAKAEALRDFGTVPGSAISLGGSSPPPATADLATLQARAADREQELERLRAAEEARKTTVAGLEREQEALVEKIGFISSQAMLVEGGAVGASGGSSYCKVLEAKSVDLDRQLASAELSCAEQRLELDRLRSVTAEALAQTNRLRQSYDELQKSADERVLRIPHGAASVTASSADIA